MLRPLPWTLVLVVLLPQDVAACTCSGPRNALEAVAAPVLFEGTVVRIEVRDTPPSSTEPWYGYAPVEVEFEVERVWRGRLGLRLVLATGYGGGDCGYSFEIGTSYVVPAYRAEAGGSLTTGLCAGVQSSWEAKPVLARLGEGRRPLRRMTLPTLTDRAAPPWRLLAGTYTAIAVLLLGLVSWQLYGPGRRSRSG